MNNLKNISSNISEVCFGKKIKDGKILDVKSVVFFVKEKKPLIEIPNDELIPDEVTISGETFITDVVKEFNVSIVPCDGYNECYDVTNLENRTRVRPIKGGLSISKTSSSATGTLGFIAKHTPTGGLVGVTNAHVLSKYPTSLKHWSTAYGSDLSYKNYEDYVYQPGAADLANNKVPENLIGRAMYSYPINTQFNSIDAAIFALDSSVILNEESFLQLGLSMSEPPEFATTEELDSILSNNIPLASTGRTTGPKEGDLCGLSLLYENHTTLVTGYRINISNVVIGAWFQNVMVFTRVNPDCPDPTVAGDSGSAILGLFNDKWKIVGLVFAGGYIGDANSNDVTDIGVFCRIDKILQQFDIEPWDGTEPNYIDYESYNIHTLPGKLEDIKLTIENDVYWSTGLNSNL